MITFTLASFLTSLFALLVIGWVAGMWTMLRM